MCGHWNCLRFVCKFSNISICHWLDLYEGYFDKLINRVTFWASCFPETLRSLGLQWRFSTIASALLAFVITWCALAIIFSASSSLPSHVWGDCSETWLCNISSSFITAQYIVCTLALFKVYFASFQACGTAAGETFSSSALTSFFFSPKTI